jgi:hypothetical protein
MEAVKGARPLMKHVHFSPLIALTGSGTAFSVLFLQCGIAPLYVKE